MSRAALLIGTIACTSALTAYAAAPARTPSNQPEQITFSKHIAPILNRHCVTCHRPGAIGPFALTTFPDVRPRAALIAAATHRRAMPPWKPEPGFGEFQGERRLSTGEVDLIRRWVEAGAPEGDQRDLPPMPDWPQGWQLGEPDLIITMPDSYRLPATGDDVYRNFIVPIPISETRFVRAIELKPGTTRGMHHARITLDRAGVGRRFDAEDVEPGYDGMRLDDIPFPDGHFLGWAPGKLPTPVPDGLAWRLEPGTDMVLKTHLLPRGVPQDVQVTAGLYFTSTPPTATPVALHLGSMTIDIPAGAPAHVVEDTYRVPVDVDALGIYPHAHFLARQIECFATLPDGSRRWLLRIADWDFNWQDEYRYARPVPIPAGSTLVMRYVFDNSAANPRNPNRPPRRVRFGPKSTDEMAEMTLQLLPRAPASLDALRRDAEHQMMRIVLAGSEKQVAEDPSSPTAHHELGVNLVGVGRIEEAVAHLREAIRLDPALAPAHYNLGTTLIMQGRDEEAIAVFRRTIDLRPNDPEAHNNLGGLLQLQGNHAEAERQYRLTMQLNPGHARAHFNLGSLLLAHSRFPEAEAEFRGTLRVTPNHAAAYTGLGRALAGQGRARVTDAVEAHRAAIRLDPGNAAAHRHLGDALKVDGKLAEAEAAFTRARALESQRR